MRCRADNIRSVCSPLIQPVNMLSLKAACATVLCEKGTEERKRPQAMLLKAGLVKEAGFYLQIHIAEQRKRSTMGLRAWGALRYCSPTPRICVHPDTTTDLTQAACWHLASYTSY